MPPDPNLRHEDAFSLLYGRDECSDAFGPIASNALCSPGKTLCCVRRGQEFPSCQQYLGKGWCCTGGNATDNCYIDQPSACEEPNSVPCTNLAEGTTEACCPRLTSCSPEFPAHEVVRCNIQHGDLQRAAQAGVTSSASVGLSSATSTSTTPEESTTTALASSTTAMASTTGTTSSANATNVAQTSLPPDGDSREASSSAPPPAGLIGGTAVGATLGFVLVVLLGYLVLRKRSKKRRLQQQGGYPQLPPPPPAAAAVDSSSYSHYHPPPVFPGQAQGYPDYAQMKGEIGNAYQCGLWSGPAELEVKYAAANNEPVELWASGR
ncbi:uncharacterized protein B0T15DRAFT_299658 [Chaetomium strumarium]|uniref:Uncharacterized protein n=1 Tax=Chaetomium strumarium TaxID=1170767 RepID=A0AAJ0LYD5_9PEZI|nr:hypothetical protein B0T15DRAFT_299658 [Chaetomium strumarium]